MVCCTTTYLVVSGSRNRRCGSSRSRSEISRLSIRSSNRRSTSRSCTSSRPRNSASGRIGCRKQFAYPALCTMHFAQAPGIVHMHLTFGAWQLPSELAPCILHARCILRSLACSYTCAHAWTLHLRALRVVVSLNSKIQDFPNFLTDSAWCFEGSLELCPRHSRTLKLEISIPHGRQ